MKRTFLLVLLFIFGISSGFAQRKMEHLDRGVVAVRNASGNFFVSWRFFATDPELIPKMNNKTRRKDFFMIFDCCLCLY
jgi:hypothetical protein